MNESMYRSKEINPDNPVEVENNLGVFEHEITPVFDKLMLGDRVSLSRSELEKLMIFLSLLSFRSNLRKEQYRNASFDSETMKELATFKGEEGFELFWKKEINALAKCRNYKDMYSAKDIDSVIKHEFELDLRNYYMTIVETSEEHFLISDIYPTLEIFPISVDFGSYMHAFYPISSTRCLVMSHLLFSDPFAFFEQKLQLCMMTSRIRGSDYSSSLIETKKHNEASTEDVLIYTVSKICKDDVEYINCLILNETRKGIAFSEPEKIIQSLMTYKKEKHIKNDFGLLEQEINK